MQKRTLQSSQTRLALHLAAVREMLLRIKQDFHCMFQAVYLGVSAGQPICEQHVQGKTNRVQAQQDAANSMSRFLQICLHMYNELEAEDGSEEGSVGGIQYMEDAEANKAEVRATIESVDKALESMCAAHWPLENAYMSVNVEEEERLQASAKDQMLLLRNTLHVLMEEMKSGSCMNSCNKRRNTTPLFVEAGGSCTNT